jgi:hypothetical protein
VRVRDALTRISEEHRLQACSFRQLAEMLVGRGVRFREKCCRQAAGNCRLAACAPQSARKRVQLFAGGALQRCSSVFAI